MENMQMLISNEQKYKQLEAQKLKSVDEHLTNRTVLSHADREQYGGMLRSHVEAQNDIVLENAKRFQSDIKAESDKSKDKRREQYAEERLKYGNRVTMETAAMERNIERFNKSWEKEQKNMNLNRIDDFKKAVDDLDVSGNMFDITVIQGSKQHIDIKKILHTRNLLRALVCHPKLPEMMHQLSMEQQVRLRTAMAAQGALEVATNTLLYENGFDENGELHEDFNAVRKESANSGITELIREREMLGHSEGLQDIVDEYKSAINRSLFNSGKDIEFTEKEMGMLQTMKTKVHQQTQQAETAKDKECGMLLDKVSDEKVIGATKLAHNYLTVYEQYVQMNEERASYVMLLKELIKKDSQDKVLMGKLRIKIRACEHDGKYMMALHQSRRLGRMLRGVCENKPLTIAMRLELAEVYGLEEYAINDTVQQANNVVYEKLKPEEQEEMERKADKFQNFLGGRSINSLSVEEQEENEEIIEFILKYDSRRTDDIAKLENWLKSDTETQQLENALLLDGEKIRDETKQSSAFGKIATAGKFAGYGKLVASGINSDGVLDTAGKVAGFITNNKSAIKSGLDKLAEGAGVVADIGAVAKFADGVASGNLSVEDTAKAVTGVADIVRVVEKFSGASKTFTDNMQLGILGINSLVDAVTSQVNYEQAKERLANTQNQINEFKKMKNVPENEKKELERLTHMLESANKTADLDKMNSAVHAASGYASAAGSAFKYLGVTAVVTGAISGAAGVANFASDRYTATKKAGLRRDYLKEQIKSVFEKIHSNEEFKNLSNRDIKHTVLKFMGTKTGKWSEAGIRKMAADSSSLLEKDNNATIMDLRKKTRRAIGVGDHATRAEIMKALGANSSQAANPIKAANEIYKKRLERSKDFAPGKWKRFTNFVGSVFDFVTRE